MKKIKTEELRNKVAVWQKYLSNASTRFRFDSFSSVEECSSGSQEKSELENDIAEIDTNASENDNIGANDACTPSDSGTCILVAGISNQMEEPLTNGRTSGEVKLLSTPEEIVPRNKSPVQQWVDSLPSDETIGKVDDVLVPAESTDAEVEGFTLGAEAVGITSPRPYPYVQITNTCGGSDAGSHCSSMESLLESRRPDPEEILLELGFGGAEESDTVSRIPARFLQPSTLKGVVIEDFLKNEQLMGHTYASGFSGYRGLAGPYYTMPSGIVGKIMERLREAEVGRTNNRHHLNTTHYKLSQKESVLSPDNRKWLERQGVSPEPEGRRIILGEKSFVLAKDGGIVEGSYKNEKRAVKGEALQKTEKDNEVKSEKENGKETAEKDEDDDTNHDVDSDSDDKSRPDEAVVNANNYYKPKGPPRLPSLDNEQLEMEYKTIDLLAKQLKGSEISVDIVSEDDFYKLTSDERKRIERNLVENALYTYQRRLRDLDLRTHLKEILASQADKVSNILGRSDHEWINIARQMTTLLRHQETLRQELRFTRNSYGQT